MLFDGNLLVHTLMIDLRKGLVNQELFAFDNLEFTRQSYILGTGADHYFELSRFDYEMHLPIPEGEVLGFQDQSDGFGFAGLEMNPFEAAEVLFVSRNAGHEFVRVELNNFVAFARAGVGYVERHRDLSDKLQLVVARDKLKFIVHGPVATARGTDTSDLRSDLQIAVREGCVTQAVTEKVKGSVNACLLAFPLRARFGRKVVGDLPDCLWESNC